MNAETDWTMILHLDMDAFYASIEQLHRPELRGRCVIVGGDSDRGVVTTASYEARRFGIRSAMPMFQARQKCPHAVVVPPRMALYRDVSATIMGILGDMSPIVEKVSIDEAYLDLSGLQRIAGPTEAIARQIKRHIRDATGLSCSIGVAPLKFLAKIASDMEKPDGCTIIRPEKVMAVIETLPVGKVSGVGKVASERLSRMGVRTLGDIQKVPEKALVGALGKFGLRLQALSWGVDPSTVVAHQLVKSISSEDTLAFDTDDKEALRRILGTQSETVGRQLRRQGFLARTVTLKIKHSDFRQITRSITLGSPTQSDETILHTAARLLDDYVLQSRVRLVGVGASNLVGTEAPRQLPLFPGCGPCPDARWHRLDPAVDRIREKFGPASIRKASALRPDEEAEPSPKGRTPLPLRHR